MRKTRAMSIRQMLGAALVAMALLAVVSGSAKADLIIAQQGGDFQANFNGHPDTIGSGTWTYMYSNKINPMEIGVTTGLMTWVGWGYAASNEYPDFEFRIVGSRLTAAPEVGGGSAERYGVMRWTSGVSGSVNVTGTWTPYWAPSWGGTGMDVAVYANGVQMFSALLMPTDSAGLDFAFGVNVVPGFVIDYVVGPGPSNNGSFDRAYIETAITPVPGAVLLGLLGMGAAGVKLRRFA